LGLLAEPQKMIQKILLLVLAGHALAGDPGVFENYFDDTIKEVDISFDSAIKACLQNGDTFADKVKKAYDDSFGDDYSFDELASSDGKDSDNDGLPDNFQGNEKKFYKELGWVDGNDVKPDAVKADMAGLAPGMKTEFDDNIDKCAQWNGDFSSRRKREAGEEEVSNVPSVMESGSSALNWLKAVRKTRSAEEGKGKKKGKGGKTKNKSARKGKKGEKKGTRSGRKGRKGGKKGSTGTRKGKERKRKGKKGGKKGKKGTRKGKGKRKGKKGGKKRNKGTRKGKGEKRKEKKRGRKGKKGGKKGNKDKRKGKEGKKTKGASKEKNGARKGKEGASKGKGGKKGKGRSQQEMQTSTYNKLWCFDLSLEQILEKCVEEKIKN